MKHTQNYPKTLHTLHKLPTPEFSIWLKGFDSKLKVAKIPAPKREEYKAALVNLYMYTDTVTATPSRPNKTCAHLFVFKDTYQGHSYWKSLMQALGEW